MHVPMYQLEYTEYTLPLLGNNATVTPLDNYSDTPPYTSPIYHYYFPIIRLFLYSPLRSTQYITTTSPLSTQV